MCYKKTLLSFLMLCFAFMGVAKAEILNDTTLVNNRLNNQLKAMQNGQVVDTIIIGLRPNGCWMEPFVFQLHNNGPSTTITIIDWTPNDFFTLVSPELPYDIGNDEIVDVELATGSSQNTEWQLVALYGNDRTASVWDITAEHYDPAIPDTWEFAYDLGTLNSGFSYQGIPSQYTPTTLHNDYNLPFPEIPEGNDAVYKFTVSNDMIIDAHVDENAENGKVALYTEDFFGEGGPMSNNYYEGYGSTSGDDIYDGPVIQNLPIKAGTYYLVASSTDADFLVFMEIDDMPCPQVNGFNFNPTPSNNEDGVDPNSVTLRWDVPNYATGWRLVFGTTTQLNPNHPQTIIYPDDGSFTKEMANSYTVRNLWNNTNYFWRIDFNNDNCDDYASSPTWNFTTHLNVPQNLIAYDETVFNDQQIVLSWNAVFDRTYRTYYIYRDGEKVGETQMNNINYTTYTDGPLAYNMNGYIYYVTAIYDEGESAPSNTVSVRVSGYGDLEGHVYHQDGQTGFSGATVTLVGTDEFGVGHTYQFTTNSEGYYSAHIYAGNYEGQVYRYGYHSLDEPQRGTSFTINYNQTTSSIDYTLVPNNYEISASANPIEGGTVSGANTYPYETNCTLIASANEGYHFVNWTVNNSVVSTSDTLEFVVIQDSSFVANFALDEHVITALSSNVEEGTVSGGGTYPYGDTCTLVATPATGYSFQHWRKNGSQVSADPNYSFVVTQDETYYGYFRLLRYTVNAWVNPDSTGTVYGTGIYDYGTTATVTAVPATGYQFVSWTRNDSVVSTSPSYSVVVTGTVVLVANFGLKGYEITASVDPAEGGSVSGAGSYHHYDSCTLVASPATGYHFVNWTLDGSVVGTSETYQFEVVGAAHYVANFALNSYEITASVNPSVGGSVEGAGTYEHFDVCTLVATPSTGYHFVNWTLNGGVVGTSETYEFVVSGAAHYVANFALNSYEITAAANPLVGGSVSGTGSYEHFETCTLTATASTGYHFVSWTLEGSVVGTSETYQFEVVGAAHFVANFALNEYEITAAVEPAVGGSVSGTGSYEHFETCTLVATPSVGYHFVSWTLDGSVVGTEETYEFEVTGSAHYVANFEINSYEITVVASPSEGGTVTGEGVYEHFSTCTLTAAPTVGYYFVSWTLDGEVVSTSETYQFEVTGAADYVANFELEDILITAITSSALEGTVTGGGSYHYGDTCTLVATPAYGYQFLYWRSEGNQVSSSPTYSFVVHQSASFVAYFRLNRYTVSAIADPVVGGSVSGGGVYDHGSTCTLVATANPGYEFLHWTHDGEVVSTSASYSLTVTQQAFFVAHFALGTFDLTVEASPEEGGNVTGGGTYANGSTATLEATANSHYQFVNWTLEGEVVSVSETYSFAVTANGHYVANFEELPQYAIAVDEVEGVTITVPASAYAGDLVTVVTECDSLHRLVSLFYYTDDPASVTPISLFTKQFVMPGANVTIGGESLLANKGDANLDGLVNILDVIVTINYICGNDPQPFSFENADMDSDNVIDISDAFAINALIHSLKGDCGGLYALYDIVDGRLYVESQVPLAGLQLTLSSEPTVLDLPGFAAAGNWRDGDYVLCLFNLNDGLEPGQHAVIDLNGGTADDVLGATLEGCKVLMEKGTLGVSNTDGYGYAVYPVPARDQVTVEGSDLRSVEVYDLLGQRVISVENIQGDHTEIKVSALTPGSYFVRINGIVSKKIVVR